MTEKNGDSFTLKASEIIESERHPWIAHPQAAFVRVSRIIGTGGKIDESRRLGADISHPVNDQRWNAQQGWTLTPENEDVDSVRTGAPRPDIVERDFESSVDECEPVKLLAMIDPRAYRTGHRRNLVDVHNRLNWPIACCQQF